VDTLLQQFFGSAVTRYSAAGAVILAVLLGLRAWIMHLVKERVNFQFAEQLESHKSELQRVLEQDKFDLQRRLTAGSLYMQRQHDAAARSYKLIRRAHGEVAGIFGAQRSFALALDCSREDLIQLMAERNIYRGKQEQILAAWTESPEKGSNAFAKYMFDSRLPRAHRALTKARNQVYLNELYFSDETNSAFHAFVEACNMWFIRVEFPPERGMPFEERPDLDARLEALRLAMRAELTDPRAMVLPIARPPDAPDIKDAVSGNLRDDCRKSSAESQMPRVRPTLR
jgi:hypothetical protein